MKIELLSAREFVLNEFAGAASQSLSHLGG